MSFLQQFATATEVDSVTLIGLAFEAGSIAHVQQLLAEPSSDDATACSDESPKLIDPKAAGRAISLLFTLLPSPI